MCPSYSIPWSDTCILQPSQVRESFFDQPAFPSAYSRRCDSFSPQVPNEQECINVTIVQLDLFCVMSIKNKKQKQEAKPVDTLWTSPVGTAQCELPQWRHHW